jgi:hypothetical protein
MQLETIRLVRDGDPAGDAAVVNVGSDEERRYREAGYAEPRSPVDEEAPSTVARASRPRRPATGQ